MINPQHYRKLMKQYQLDNHIGRSAIKAGIDPKTAGKYIKGEAGPEKEPGERCWRTHPDAFAQVWPGVEEMLFREPELQAKVIFEKLLEKECGKFSQRQRRSFERRVRAWKGRHGAVVPCGSSLLTESHHWMLRLMQGGISSKDLQADVGGILSIKDSELIIETMRTGQFGLRKRALSVAAHLKGIASRPISQFLMVNRESIREYIKRFHDGGLDELFDLNRKEVKKADDLIYKEAVFKSLHSPPRLHGFNRTTWRMQDLQSVLAAQGLRISLRNIRKIIRNAGYRFRKAKKVLTSNDPNYRQKLQAITDILQNLKADEKFFSVDEFGPFTIKIQGGRSLVKIGEIKTVPQFQISKGSLTVTAALEMSENQVTHLYSKRKNTKEMLKLLDVLLEKYAGQSCIYFSWDAASWHASKKLSERVAEINSVEYRSAHLPIVRLAPLPSSAQFLNVIESVFSGMSRAIIHNSDYQSAEECMLAIDRYFDERNENFRARPKRAGKKIWGKEIVDPSFDEANNCKDPRW
jgi:transposase